MRPLQIRKLAIGLFALAVFTSLLLAWSCWHAHCLICETPTTTHYVGTSYGRLFYIARPPGFARMGSGWHLSHTRLSPAMPVWWFESSAQEREFAMPLWLIAALSWGLGLLLWRRTRRSLPSSICRVCGYDLRATPDRCPECGTSVPNASAGSELPAVDFKR
jgi:hypothetical protein